MKKTLKYLIFIGVFSLIVEIPINNIYYIDMNFIVQFQLLENLLKAVIKRKNLTMLF